MRVMVLCDFDEDLFLSGDAIRKVIGDRFSTGDDFKTERDVIEALARLGHEVALLTLREDFSKFFSEIRRFKPHRIVNLCEAVFGDRDLEPNLRSVLDFMRIPVTGADARSLLLCKDKGLAKKIVAFHGVKVPKFWIVKPQDALKAFNAFDFPIIVKPLNQESSTGIAFSSLVTGFTELATRVRYLQDSFSSPVILEEFIDGREIYVSAICRKGSLRKVFVFRELDFGELPEKILTYKAKWNDDYRREKKVRTIKAALSQTVKRRFVDAAERVARALELDGPIRMDFRLTSGHEVFFLEANPNPALAREDDFAQAAAQAGVGYLKLMRQLLES